MSILLWRLHATITGRSAMPDHRAAVRGILAAALAIAVHNSP
jgi:hypothetical protein